MAYSPLIIYSSFYEMMYKHCTFQFSTRTVMSGYHISGHLRYVSYEYNLLTILSFLKWLCISNSE
jgi:hypothetical protein